jgi:hypothetical protein
MRRRFVAIVTAILLLVVGTRIESQPSVSAALDQAVIRVRSLGNEMIVMRQAPVAYSTIEQIYGEIGAPRSPGAVPVRIVRASPPEAIDYLFCVTSAGTLVLGERVHTIRAGERTPVFARGQVVRSYPSLQVLDGRVWIVQVPLSREATVTLQLRSPTAWPLESVAVTANDVK